MQSIHFMVRISINCFCFIIPQLKCESQINQFSELNTSYDTIDVELLALIECYHVRNDGNFEPHSSHSSNKFLACASILCLDAYFDIPKFCRVPELISRQTPFDLGS